MPISVTCGDCGREYNVKDDAAGRRFKCKDCGSTVDVPTHSAPLASSSIGAGESSGIEGSSSFEGANFDSSIRSDYDADFGGIPRRRSQSEAFPSASNESGGRGLALASMWIGIVVWGLGLLTILIFSIMIGVSIDDFRPGRGPEGDAAAGIVIAGMSLCAYVYCLAPVGSITGTVLGLVALSQGTDSKAQAIIGIVLNASLLLIGVSLILLMFLGVIVNR